MKWRAAVLALFFACGSDRRDADAGVQMLPPDAGSVGGGGSGGSGSGGGSAGGSAGGGSSGGLPDCVAPVHGCTAFVEPGPPGIQFGTATSPDAPSPACADLGFNLDVMFTIGAGHKLVWDCGPHGWQLPDFPGGSQAIFIGVEPGLYGYHCKVHGFGGVVRVLPP